MKIPSRGKQLLKQILINTKLLKFVNNIYFHNIVILKYHSIKDNPAPYDNSIEPGIITSTEDFRKHMEILRKEFNPVSLTDILLFMRGDKTLPKKAVAVTFDDGFSDNFEIAAPILDHFEIKATFYITTGAIETPSPPWFVRVRNAIWSTKKTEWLAPEDNRFFKIVNRSDRVIVNRHVCNLYSNLPAHQRERTIRDLEIALDVNPYTPKSSVMMTWENITRLHKNGHIIGSHTMSHPNIAHIGKDELHLELVQSKRLLEEKLNAPVIHFSYPNPGLNPQFTEQTTAAVREAQYETAVLSSHGPIKKGGNPLLLERLCAAPQRSEFIWNLECILMGRRV